MNHLKRVLILVVVAASLSSGACVDRRELSLETERIFVETGLLLSACDLDPFACQGLAMR